MHPAIKDDIAARKQTLRAEARARRRALAAADTAASAGALAVEHFRDALRLARPTVVAGYWPLPDEFDCRPLLTALHAEGHCCALPVVTGRARPLTFRVWTPRTVLRPGPFGVSAPPDDAASVRPDVILTPLLAFDDAGFRLGYGGGYYDRTLAALRSQGPAPLAVGLAYAGQHVAAVPTGPNDAPLDWLVSETGATRFQRGAA